MKRKIIKETDSIKVYQYPNPLSKKDLYIMYLYKKEKYKEYKTYILSNKFIITKIYINDGFMKFCYKRGYNPLYKIKYYYKYSQIGLSKQIELSLI